MWKRGQVNFIWNHVLYSCWFVSRQCISCVPCLHKGKHSFSRVECPALLAAVYPWSIRNMYVTGNLAFCCCLQRIFTDIGWWNVCKFHNAESEGLYHSGHVSASGKSWIPVELLFMKSGYECFWSYFIYIETSLLGSICFELGVRYM